VNVRAARLLRPAILGAMIVVGACAERGGAAPPRTESPLPAPGPTAPEARRSSLPAKPGPEPTDASTPDGQAPSARWRPDQDLDPDHFHERVDGAAPALISLGCRRLLYFRRESPPADLELLVFATADGAREALSRDAGDARTRGLPGDEAWADEQCVFFRSGAVYVRLIADDRMHAGALREEAERVSRALADRALPQ
jgi:hypothetical protein